MIRKLISIFTALVLVLGCISAAALGAGSYTREPGEPEETTPPAPTETPVTPTETPVTPTETPVTPTETPVTPTETPVTPTETPVETTPTPKPGHLVITTDGNLPPKETGATYAYRLQANYADAVFSLVSGSSLNGTGLSLSNNRLTTDALGAPGTYRFTLAAASVQAGETVTKEFTLVILPTEATPEPTVEPTVTPDVTPVPDDLLEPDIFWGRAADTVQYVRINTPFEIKLVEGLIDRIVYTGVNADLPEGIEIVAGDGEVRYVAVKGVLTDETPVEFTVDFLVEEQGRLGLSFVLLGRKGAEAPADEFPAGKPLVPFGGTAEAVLPAPARKKEEEDA